MSTRSTKTIDDLGITVYSKYEEDRKYFDEEILSESKSIASQTTLDIFEPILISEHFTLFDINRGKTPFSMIFSPKKYNDQKKRLFTFQLAPKLGPQEMIDVHINRIEGRRDQELSSLKKGKEFEESEKEKEKKREKEEGQEEKSQKEEVEELPTPSKKKLKESKESTLASLIIENNEEKEVLREAKILIQLMQDINILNKLISYIDAERHRYSKG